LFASTQNEIGDPNRNARNVERPPFGGVGRPPDVASGQARLSGWARKSGPNPLVRPVCFLPNVQAGSTVRGHGLIHAVRFH